MARRKPGPGRPNKGPRLLFTVRMPAALADAVRADAERLDLTYSDYVANLVAETYGEPPVATPKDDKQMKLTA